MKVVLDESGIGMKVVLDEIFTFGMKVVLDDLVFYRYSTSVLELLQSEPRIFGILAILEPRLSVSFIDESKPVFF